MTETFTPEQEQTLLAIAKATIETGLSTGKFSPLDPSAIEDPKLLEIRASFVTLEIDKKLRGCIGHLEPVQPLALDIAENAFSAAFGDPRFSRLSNEELPKIEIHLSVLTLPAPMEFSSEEDLLEKIRPSVDGLILMDGSYRGTFLPAVWESLPTKQEFWTHLKMKAGLPPNHWSPTLQVHRYEAVSIPRA